MLDDHLPDFSGKHIGLYITGRPTQTFLVQDAARAEPLLTAKGQKTFSDIEAGRDVPEFTYGEE
jgi:hypothetical protein